jgi:hypothetical protein
VASSQQPSQLPPPKPDPLDWDADFYLNEDETACGSDPADAGSVPANSGIIYNGTPNHYPDKVKTDANGNALGFYLLPDCLNPDDDQDLMLDDCEQKIIDASATDAITSVAQVLPAADFDGDGVSNLVECQNGTDPTLAPAAEFELTVVGEDYNRWLPGYGRVLTIQARWEDGTPPASALFSLQATSKLAGRAENDPAPVANAALPMAAVSYPSWYQYYGFDFGLTPDNPAVNSAVHAFEQGPLAVAGVNGTYTVYLQCWDYGGRTKLVVSHPTDANIRSELWIPKGSGNNGIGSAWQYDSDADNRLPANEDKDAIISENWQLKEIDISAYAGQTVRFAFYHQAARDGNDNPSESSGWLVDEVKLATRDAVSKQDLALSDLGWTQWAEQSAAGIWQIGTLAQPPGTGPQSCYRPIPEQYDQLCAATVLGADYPAATDSRLVSAQLTLAPAAAQQQLYLRFMHWYSYAMLDAGTVQISVYDQAAGQWSDWQNLAKFKNHTGIGTPLGDDFNNFEEYRGILYIPSGGSQLAHMRLNPFRQDLFVRAEGFDDAAGDPYRPFDPPPDGYGNYYPFRLGLALKNAGVDVHNITGWGHDATGDGSFFSYYTAGSVTVTPPLRKLIQGTDTGWAEHWPKREWEFKMAGDAAAPWVPITAWDGANQSLSLAVSYEGASADGAYLIRRPLPHINTVIMRHDRTSPSAVSNKDGYINFLTAAAPGYLNADGTRVWEWDQKGHASTNSTTDHPTMYGYATTYQVPLDHYFGDRPYLEGTVWTGSGFTADPVIDGKLAPLSKVEDQYDALAPIDGALGDEPDAFWDGDRRTKDQAGWYDAAGRVSPFDIDGNGYVELPAATDPDADNFDRQHDLNGMPYTKARVLKHTASHEMVHAIAGPPHSYIETCLMYDISNNWNKDNYISEEIRTLLRIHNLKR